MQQQIAASLPLPSSRQKIVHQFPTLVCTPQLKVNSCPPPDPVRAIGPGGSPNPSQICPSHPTSHHTRGTSPGRTNTTLSLVKLFRDGRTSVVPLPPWWSSAAADGSHSHRSSISSERVSQPGPGRRAAAVPLSRAHLRRMQHRCEGTNSASSSTIFSPCGWCVCAMPVENSAQQIPSSSSSAIS